LSVGLLSTDWAWFSRDTIVSKKEAVLCLKISFRILGLSYRHTKRPTRINPSWKCVERTGLL